MYAKLYSKITDSSLMEEPIEVRYTFMMFLAICDLRGEVVATDKALARKLNMPIEELKGCIKALMKPDADSGLPDEDGRRIVLLDGERGYQVVNYEFYKNLRSSAERQEYMREYMVKYRAKKKASGRRLNGKEQAELEGAEAAQGAIIAKERGLE